MTGCASHRDPPPPPVPHALVTELGTLCLTPLASELEIPDEDPRLRVFERVVTEELQHAGFVVVAPSRVREVWKREMTAGGAVFDPHTGDLDEAKEEKVQARVRAALQAELGCRGIVGPSVVVVTATFSGSRLTWDGVTDEMDGGGGHYGTTAAASLWLSISDLNGKEVYFRAGGIQPLEEIGYRGWVGSPYFEPVASEEILLDPLRNRRAAQASLAPMLGQKATLLAVKSEAEKRYLERWEHLRNDDAPR